MLDAESITLPAAIAIFVVATALIGVFGTWMSRLADRLADLTGMGEALMGGIFLGSMTSLSGITTSVTAAAEGHAQLSISNAIGGLAVQTAFLGVADMVHRKVNLEYAATSVSNMMQAALLISLLTLPLLAATAPQVEWLGVHPVSIVLLIAYVAGMRQVARTQQKPMWRYVNTPQTEPDIPDEEEQPVGNTLRVWGAFLLSGVVIVICGYSVAQAGIALVEHTGLSEGFVGAVFTGVCTSLPELVISVAAVRAGALTLAIGGVVGGNCFDVLFLSFSDMAYRKGSIYHDIGDQQLFFLGLTILLNCIVLMGLLRREKRGIANIGWESFLVLILYVGAIAVMA